MQKFLKYFITLVWLVNGLICKILNLVPRHQVIVSEILQVDDGRGFTILIGIGEVLIAFMVLSFRKLKLIVYLQIVIVITMNILKLIFVPQLLLWGKLNIVFATIFCLFLLYYLKLSEKSIPQ